jgi:hypothetical protein
MNLGAPQLSTDGFSQQKECGCLRIGRRDSEVRVQPVVDDTQNAPAAVDDDDMT